MVGTVAALSAPLQTHLMDVATGAETLAAASHHAAFNTANALGPFLGGLAISAGQGRSSTGYVGAATALVGLGFFLWARQRERGKSRKDQGEVLPGVRVWLARVMGAQSLDLQESD